MIQQNKKALILSPTPLPFGGIATLTKILMEKGLPAPYEAQILDTKNIAFNEKNILFKIFLAAKREVKIVLKLFFILIFKRPSVVHLNCSVSPNGVHRDLVCIFLARALGVPTLTHYHGNIGDYNVREQKVFSNFSIKYLMRFNSINIFSNIPSLNSAINKFDLEKNLDRNYIIPNYASDKVWNFEHQVLDKKNITCAFVGNLSVAKGTDLIVKLANSLPEVNFDLIGRVGADVEELLTKHKPKNIKLCGLMDQLDVYKHLTTVDVFLFPSHTEGFPLSIVEAMSIGLPIVCTEVGSLPEMIDVGRGGFIHPVNDFDNFRLSILKLHDYNTRKDLGHYNRVKSEANYRFDRVANRLIESYNKIT
jgi:glycosyltransferase involved in cell wall biosynthesis